MLTFLVFVELILHKDGTGGFATKIAILLIPTTLFLAYKQRMLYQELV